MTSAAAPLRIVEAGGAPFTRGATVGAALAEPIRAHLEAWLAWLTRVLGQPAEAYVRGMVRATSFEPAIERHAADLLDELRGIAAGAAADFELLYALQLMDEEWAYRRREGFTRRAPDKCSSFAIVGEGGRPTWIGQNMDLPEYTDGFQAAVRIAADDKGPGALLFTTAGMIGLMGVNEVGLGVCVNSLPQLPSAPAGLPVAFVLRRLLQARSVDEAARWVTTLPHATNQHYVLAEAGQVRSFEASAAGVTEYRPPDASRVLHTNHPLTKVQGDAESEAERRNSVRRLQSLTERLGEGEPTLAALQAALGACDDPDNPVCRTGGGGNIGFTCGSMISALPGKGRIVEAWLSAGPPTRAGFTPLTLGAEAAA
jgi:hypothetical protein